MLKQNSSNSLTEAETRVKCVLIGDGAVGKTSLIISYTTNGFPLEYLPTAFDNYSVQVSVNEEPVTLQLCDTAGQDDFDLLRPLCYPNADIFVLCFSVVCPTSFYNVREKWLTEIWSRCAGIPIILVGTQLDLRNDVKVLLDLGNYGERPITEAEGRSKAREIGAIAYIECSALTQKNMKEVFDLAITAALSRRKPAPSINTPAAEDADRKRKNSLKKVNYAVQKSRNNSDAMQPSRHRWKRSFCCFVC